MKVILLSGGSGKRLWPLSNDTRSKQFLRLLASPSGEQESMVQRVVRQIVESQITDSITLATSNTQHDIITNQLGASIDLVTEPERHDTFPAIALAVNFLLNERQCDPQEVIVVMPCDVYTEAGYFKAAARMAEAAARDEADIVLMGIRPTSGTTEFGYIVPGQPQKGQLATPVQQFVEKPSRDRAAALLKEAAWWNAGVFAFKAAYLQSIVDRYVPSASFAQLRAQYGRLPRISFDYEVVEQAARLAFVSYSGQWKDIGTWDALAEELPTSTIGRVTLAGEVDNTHAINELDLPLLCVGTRDLVVAASPDGLLVAAKDAGEMIKDYVERMPARPMYEERRWGEYKVLNSVTFPDGHQILTKELRIAAGKGISYQKHLHRDEVWTFVDGEGLLVIDDKVTRVGRGTVVNIVKGQMHAVKALTPLTFIEVQSGDMLVEEDILRFPWDWDAAEAAL